MSAEWLQTASCSIGSLRCCRTPPRCKQCRCARGSSVAVKARGTVAPALNTWTHFAVTYDGATIRMYVNGVQTGTRAQTGALRTSTQPLRFGGNAVWPEWFRGRLDEVRIYNRALTGAQIQADMAKAVSSPTLLRAAGKTGAKRPVAKTKRSAGAKLKRYRGRFTHYGKWLG